MNTLLLFFAFPIAVIIFSIVLQNLLDNPLAVSALIFAVFIVITFWVFDQTFLIATLAYTALSFLTAIITDWFCYNQNNNTAFNIETVTEDDNVITNNYSCMCNRKREKC